MAKKILLFCDPGVDDALAIMYTMLDPELDLVGIVTSYGNVTREQAAANAAYLVHLAGREDIAIILGADQPVREGELEFYPEIHGEEGIGLIRPPADFSYQAYSFDTIRLLIEKYKGDLIIVDTGRLTTLAIFFNLFPEHKQFVHSFYVMGGAFFVPGNATPLAEANLFGDPTAAHFVLNTFHNLTLTPLNVTQHAILTQHMIDRIAAGENNVYTSIITPLFQYYYEYYQKAVPGIPGAPIHDLLTVLLIDHPEVVQYIYDDIHVVEHGEAKGMSYIDYRPASKNGKTRIAVHLDYERFIEEFLSIMLR